MLVQLSSKERLPGTEVKRTGHEGKRSFMTSVAIAVRNIILSFYLLVLSD